MTQQAGDTSPAQGQGTPNPVAPTDDAAKAAAAAAAQAAAAAKSGETPTTLDDKSPAGTAPADTQAPKPDDAPTPVTYEKTGNVGLDMALAFVGKLGIDPEHDAMKAAGDGDFTMLKALIAGMAKDKTQGWEQMLELGEASFKTVSAAHAERAKADRAAIYKAVGGEDNWKEVQSWANTNAEEGERSAINAALKAGGVQAKATAYWLAGMHAAWKQSQPRDGAPATRETPAGGPPVGASTGPLSPAQFREARNALIDKLGTSYVDGHPEYIALTNRRRAYKG